MAHAVILAACAAPPDLPTSVPIVEALSTLTSTPSPSPTLAQTPSPELATPLPTATDMPPTASPEPTATPGPVEYVIQPGDTLLFIIQRPPFNYRDLSVIPEIIRLNSTIPNADRLPPPGTTILIPLPTPTATPDNAVMTGTAQASIPQVNLPVPAEIIPHQVREGETILGIAEQYRTTLRVLDTLNPDLIFLNCNFSIPSGGESCSVIIGVGTAVYVPAPTPTPTLSPTPSGLETATPTPTFAAPRVSFPPQDAVIRGNTPFLVQWVSAGVLPPAQVYLVQFENLTTGVVFNDVTRANSYRVPTLLAPASATPEQYRWRVSVAQQNPDGIYDFAGAQGVWRTFTWGI